MATIKLRDGSLGWKYPKPDPAYRPTRTPLVGVRIPAKRSVWQRETDLVIVREIGHEYVDSALYWCARVEPDGSLGKLVVVGLGDAEYRDLRRMHRGEAPNHHADRVHAPDDL